MKKMFSDNTSDITQPIQHNDITTSITPNMEVREFTLRFSFTQDKPKVNTIVPSNY